MGSHKHGVSGHVHTNTHFTGHAKGTGSKRKAKSTHKQRRKRRGTHVNKYARATAASAQPGGA